MNPIFLFPDGVRNRHPQSGGTAVSGKLPGLSFGNAANGTWPKPADSAALNERLRSIVGASGLNRSEVTAVDAQTAINSGTNGKNGLTEITCLRQGLGINCADRAADAGFSRVCNCRIRVQICVRIRLPLQLVAVAKFRP